MHESWIRLCACSELIFKLATRAMFRRSNDFLEEEKRRRKIKFQFFFCFADRVAAGCDTDPFPVETNGAFHSMK